MNLQLEWTGDYPVTWGKCLYFFDPGHLTQENEGVDLEDKDPDALESRVC
jgi:hypothetical protein